MKNRSGSHQLSRGGFTLIEVMVVVAIIGVMTSLSVVGYQSVMRNARTNGEADMIAQFLKNARLRAVSTGCPHVVRYVVPPTTSPMTAGSLTMYRKANCQLATTDLPQTTTAPLDVLVNRYETTPNMWVVSSSAAANLAGRTYYVGFTVSGTPLSAYDNGTLTALGSATMSINVRARETEKYARDVTITGAGDVLAQ